MLKYLLIGYERITNLIAILIIMKQLIFSLAIVITLFSCGDTGNNISVIKDTVANAQLKQAVTPVNVRQLLIEELKSLNLVLSSKDKYQIQPIFNFPLADSAVEFYSEDESFNKDKIASNGLVTDQLFLRHFDIIYRELQIDELQDLFSYLNVDSLREKDKLEYELKNEKQPCSKFYSIGIAGDEVTLHFRTYINTELLDKFKGNDDDVVGDTCSEFSAIWLFKITGQKLSFIRRMTAG